MSHELARGQRPGPIRFLFENSIFLIAGAAAALIWASTSPDSYRAVTQFPINSLWEEAAQSESENRVPGVASEHDDHTAHTDASHASDHGHGYTLHLPFGFTLPFAHGLTPLALINDLLMALFFAIAGKEVWEALLPGGALSNPRKAATPLFATLGGIIGPAGLYAIGALLLGQWGALGNGWAVPCATDIAFSYLVARLIFGAGHPAIAFLLLLAIADDAAGLLILAVFYPSGSLQLEWLLLSVVGVAIGFGFRQLGRHRSANGKLVKGLGSFWWYLLIPGTLSWIGFAKAGIHPALGLVPFILTLPHARTDLGIFAREELGRDDPLNAFEHWWKNPVELILGLFGLVNAGVGFSSVGAATWLVLAGLMIGKPLGITLFTWIAERVFKLEMPGGMSYRHVVSLGMIAGIGFTVALFVSTAAFPPGATLDAVKMGALGSFFAAVVAFVGARMLGIRPLEPADSMEVSEPGIEDAREEWDWLGEPVSEEAVPEEPVPEETALEEVTA